VKITADQAKNGQTVSDVTGLVFALTSGQLYRFSFYVVYRTGTATVGPRITVTHPGATVFAAAVEVSGFGADAAAADWHGAITTSGDEVVPTAVVATNTDFIAKIEGVILPSASGNLQVRVGNETNTNNITVRNGSNGLLWTL
jgi:hypothetical protein